MGHPPHPPEDGAHEFVCGLDLGHPSTQVLLWDRIRATRPSRRSEPQTKEVDPHEKEDEE